MSNEVKLISENFAAISPRVDELTLTFYTGLFSAYPESKGLFNNVDLIQQRRKLAAMLTLIVTNLSRMDVLVPVLRELGASHVQYGATPESYEWIKEALIASLCKVSGNDWTAEVEQAWSHAIDVVCREMLHGADRKRQSTPQLEQEEIGMLMEIASNPMLSFKADSLFTSYIEKKSNDQEIHLAKEVQQSLIPEAFPLVGDYTMDAVYLPAMNVSGDLYDWIMPDSEHLYLIFGDVSGKGLSGALIGSRLSGVSRSVLTRGSTTSDAVTAINKHMCERMPIGRFITLVVLGLDLKTHQFSLTNAGHPTPMWRSRDGKLRFLSESSAGGIPVGIETDAAYGQYDGQFLPGDSLTLFSDGITEATGSEGEIYGLDRLFELTSQISETGDITDHIITDVRRFTKGHPTTDDISVLTLARQADD